MIKLHRPTLIGHRKDGSPIYLIAGAAGDEPVPPPGVIPPAPDADKEGDDSGDDADKDSGLGDAGQKALDAMKAKLKAERVKSASAAARVAELERSTKTKSEGGDAPDPDAIRKQAREEALAEAKAEGLRERTLDRIEVLAARTFSDPGDARLFLAGSIDDFVDGDGVDSDAITAALANLLKQRPYLATVPPPKFGASDGGARTASDPETGPGQLRLMAAYKDAQRTK